MLRIVSVHRVAHTECHIEDLPVVVTPEPHEQDAQAFAHEVKARV